MNIIKGMDRIALVLAAGIAIAALLPIFNHLSLSYKNPDHTVWHEKFQKRVSELEDLNPSIKDQRYYEIDWRQMLNKPMPSQTKSMKEKLQAMAEIQKQSMISAEIDKSTRAQMASILDGDDELQKLLGSEPPKALNMAMWKKTLLSILGSLAIFLSVVFAIGSTTRMVKRLSLWILSGFKS